MACGEGLVLRFTFPEAANMRRYCSVNPNPRAGFGRRLSAPSEVARDTAKARLRAFVPARLVSPGNPTPSLRARVRNAG